jgi:hypothetical protein
MTANSHAPSSGLTLTETHQYKLRVKMSKLNKTFKVGKYFRNRKISLFYLTVSPIYLKIGGKIKINFL